jgi:hypothetical protein
MVQARNIAGRYALNNWDPTVMLPSYSLATSWDRVNGNTCFQWNRYRWDCVVSVNAENYSTDSFGDPTGYAWCDGTLDVLKSSRTGRIHVRDEGDETCDSTDDTSSY